MWRVGWVDRSGTRGNTAAVLREQLVKQKGQVFELRNIKEGKADPAAFESPKDFKKAATLKDVLPSDPFLDDED